MTTCEAWIIFSFFKRRKCSSRPTGFLAALFVAVVGAVVLAVAPPRQTDAASVPAAELVGRAHGGGCRAHGHAGWGQRVPPKSLELMCFSSHLCVCVCVYAGQEAHPPHASRSSNSLQFFSSDWSSQSNSPSHLQPKLMHMPLLHMNSTDLQGWWEAAHAHTTAQTCHSRKKRAAARCSGWTQEARFRLRLGCASAPG